MQNFNDSIKLFLQYTDGIFDRGTFMYILKVLVSNDPEKIKFAEKMTDQCSGVQGSRCDQAFAFASCIHEKVMSANLKIDLF
jgi:hypothetical protein